MKPKIDLTKKTLSIDISKVISKKRYIDFDSMADSDKLKYILSHYGIKSQGLDIEKKYSKVISKKPVSRIDSAIDTRPKDYFINIMRSQCTIGEHRPISSARYYGVEIECLIPFDSLNIDRDDYNRGEVECSTCEGNGEITYSNRNTGHEIESECPDCSGSGYRDSDDCDDEDSDLFDSCKRALSKKIKSLNIRGVDIKHDGSIDADGEEDRLWPVEITVLFRQDDMKNLEKICKLLNDLDTEVNSSCGLHVHLDARHLTEDDVILEGRKFKSVLSFLGKMVPSSRRNNKYCKLEVSELDGSRYAAVNLTSYNKYRTIEIRLHSSTTSFLKISNWIKVLSGVQNIQDLNFGYARSIKQFFNIIKADEDLQKYITGRVQKFSEDHNEESSGEELELDEVVNF